MLSKVSKVSPFFTACPSLTSTLITEPGRGEVTFVPPAGAAAGAAFGAGAGVGAGAALGAAGAACGVSGAGAAAVATFENRSQELWMVEKQKRRSLVL